MSDLIERYIDLLTKVGDDPAAHAVLAVEFALDGAPVSQQDALREGVNVAALLHWFDEDALRAMLELSELEAAERLAALRSLPFVERFPSAVADRCSVHEITRLAWRKHLAQNESERFRALSVRAAAYFDTLAPADAGFERVYHLLTGDPEAGARELEKFQGEWYEKARPELHSALASIVNELETSGLLKGIARANGLVCIGEVRHGEDDTEGLEPLARTALEEAKAANHLPAIGRAYGLLGDALRAQGKGAAGLEAYRQCLAIERDLLRSAPNDPTITRGVAVILLRITDAAFVEQLVPEATAACDEAFALAERSSNEQPESQSWRVILALAYSRKGWLADAAKDEAGVEAAYRKSLEVNQQAAEYDPENSERVLDVVWGNVNLSDLLAKRGEHEQAGDFLSAALKWLEPLLQRDPGKATIQAATAHVLVRIGKLMKDAGYRDAAEQAIERAASIHQQLSSAQPGNLNRQDEFAEVTWQLAELQVEAEAWEKARDAWSMYVSGYRRIAMLDPTAARRRQIAIGLYKLGTSLRELKSFAEARDAFAEAATINRALVEEDPKRFDWRRGLGLSLVEVASMSWSVNDADAAERDYTESVAVLERLLVDKPDDDDIRLQTAIVFNRFGDFLTDQNKLEAARGAYGRYLGLRDAPAEGAAEETADSLIAARQSKQD